MKPKLFIFITSIIFFTLLFPFFLYPQGLTLRNGDFSDLVWPDYYFIKNSILRYHQIPFWNPTVFSGIPEIANPQSPLIYPPNAIALFLPIEISIVILVGIHFLFAAYFLFLTGKRLFKWGSLPSIVLAYSFTISPFLWGKVSVGHISQLFATLLLTPVLYFGIKSFLGVEKRNYFLLSLFLSLQYLNHPTIWFYSILFGNLSWIYFCITLKKFKKILSYLFSCVLSLLYILPIFLIQLQAASLITRSSLNITDLALPVWSLKRFISGVLIPSNFLNDQETEVWLYPSIFALILAFFSWFKLSKKYRFIFFAIIVIVILVTLGQRTPVFGYLVHNFPGFSYLRVSTRIWFIFICVISLLCGFGISKIKGIKKVLVFVFLVSDLLIFSALRLWFIPDKMQPKNSTNLAALFQKNENLRYYCTSRCLSARDTLQKNIYTADGYHLIILKNYREAISVAGGFTPPKYTGNIPSIDNIYAQPSAKLLGDFSVKWVISKNNLLDPGFIKKDSSNGYYLYENLLVLPRIRFDFAKDNQIFIIKDTPNFTKIKTSGRKDKLILADTYFSGWEVWVDGKRDKILEYNGWARAVNLQEGGHLVEFKFNPWNNLFGSFKL